MTPGKDSGIVPTIADQATRAADSSLAPTVDPTMPARPAAPGAPVPDLERTGQALVRRRSQSIQVTVLTVLAVLYTLYFAREFLIPIVFAILLNFLLSPVIRKLARLHVRAPLGAAVVVLALVAAVGGAVYGLAGPAQRWAAIAPQSFAHAQERLRSIIRPVQQVTRNVERAANAVGEASSKAPAVVVESEPSLSSRLFGTTQRVVAGLIEIFVLLYFLLAGGDLFLQKLIKVLPHFSDKLKAIEIARATEAAVSAYLSTALLVNVVEGTVVAAVLWMLGMPNPLLWGAFVALLELVPYLGAAAIVVVLGVAALATFDQLGRALLIPASFLAINLLQANVVTPLLLGRRLTLNPVAIVVGLAFFFWIWGVPGAFLAVPLLATLKIFCDHIAAFAALGEFLGQRDEEERRLTARVD